MPKLSKLDSAESVGEPQPDDHQQIKEQLPLAPQNIVYRTYNSIQHKWYWVSGALRRVILIASFTKQA